MLSVLNLITPELNPSGATLPAEILLQGILIFKGLTVRSFYKLFRVERLFYSSVLLLGANGGDYKPSINRSL
jgi:hypothetical protein